MNPKLREHLSLRRYRHGGGQYNINSSEESGQMAHADGTCSDRIRPEDFSACRWGSDRIRPDPTAPDRSCLFGIWPHPCICVVLFMGSIGVLSFSFTPVTDFFFNACQGKPCINSYCFTMGRVGPRRAFHRHCGICSWR